MSDELERFRTALDGFGAKVHAIKDDQWGDPTPCTDWDVRALTHHLVYEMVWAAPLFEGKTVADVGDSFEGELLGDDPLGAWDRAAEAAWAAVSAPGALERSVNLSRGDVPAGLYLQELLFDLVIHGWDLAKAIGADARIDPAEAERHAAWFRSVLDKIGGGSAFASPVAVGDDATPGDELIALTGRPPDWSA